MTTRQLSAICIQKLWRGHIFKKALPYALAQQRNIPIIHGPEWGAYPSDSELCFDDVEDNLEEDMWRHDWADNVDPPTEQYDFGDAADYWRHQELYGDC